MAIARVFDGKGWSVDQYDALIEKLVARIGMAPGRSAPGVLFHWATPTEEGMRAVDVYASRDVADDLVQAHIGPLAADLGLPLPEISEYEVHSYLSQ